MVHTIKHQQVLTNFCMFSVLEMMKRMMILKKQLIFSLWPLLLALALVFMMNVELLTLARRRMTAKGPS